MTWRGLLPAGPRLPVPATAGVSAALEAGVVSEAAEVEVDLTDAGVRGDVQLPPRPRDLHRPDDSCDSLRDSLVTAYLIGSSSAVPWKESRSWDCNLPSSSVH